MACSSAAPKFTVRRRPEVLVAPAAPTPHELERLSDFDDQNWMADGALGGQIGSDPGLRAALGGRGAGGWVPGYCHLREAPEGEVETGGGFHLNNDVC